MTGVRNSANDHRGQPRRLELWVGGAWILGLVAMVGVVMLFIVGDLENGPAHPGLAWPLVVVWLASFITAWFLQNRYERPAPPQ